MLRELGERVESAVLEGIGRTSSRIQERKPLPVDLLESDDAYLAVFDAPGATKEDVEVRFDEHTLVVTVERFREYYENYEMKLPGRGTSLHGRVALPPEASVDPAGAEATVTKTGTLRVRIPKVEQSAKDAPVRVSTEDEDEDDEE